MERGLIADPTLSSWINTTTDFRQTGFPKYLILATDGLFESLDHEEICKAAVAIGNGKMLLFYVALM